MSVGLRLEFGPTYGADTPLRSVPTPTSGPNYLSRPPIPTQAGPAVAPLPTGNAPAGLGACGERHAPSYLGRSTAHLRRCAQLTRSQRYIGGLRFTVFEVKIRTIGQELGFESAGMFCIEGRATAWMSSDTV